MKLLRLFALLFVPALSFAQFTTVTGTVIDPNGLPYAGGTIAPTLVTSASPTLNGLPYTPPSQPAGLDANGKFTMQLADNTVLLPASTKWNFTVCSGTGTVNPAIGKGPVCFSLASPITISGSSQSISTQLQAAALALTNLAGGTLSSVSATSPITATPSPIVATGSIGCPTCAVGPGSSIAGHIAEFASTNGVTLQDGGPSAGGANNPVLIPSFTDYFNRASLGANYTVYLNGWTVSSGTATGTTAHLNVAAYTGASSVATQTSRVTIPALNGTNDFPGAAVRITGTPGSTASYYVCDEDSTTLFLQKVVNATPTTNGTLTNLASVAISAQVGDVLTLSVVGNTLNCSRNSTNPILQVNDSSSPLTTGAPGISTSGTVATLNSFTFLTASAPGAAATNIVGVGDSELAANGNGSNLTDPFTSFLYLPSTNAYVVNLGEQFQCLGVSCSAATSGSIESMLSIGTSVVDTLFIPGIKNIVVLWGGTNDIAIASRTPAQVYTDMTTFVTARHAAGWKVAVIPPLSRQCTTSPATDNKEQQLATLVNANTAGADAVVVLPLSLINTCASTNTNFFSSDQIHLTQIAHVEVVARAVSAALSNF